MVTVNRKIVLQLQIAYLKTFQWFIWLLRKAQCFGYCTPYNYFSTAYFPIICLLQIAKLFQHWKSPKYLVTVYRKIVWPFKSPIWKPFDDLYGYGSKPNFLATAHHTIIFLLQISQLFVYWKSTNYFTTENRLNICLLCIEKLYDNFKSSIWKNFDDLYGYCAKPIFRLLRIYYFATAHFPIFYLLKSTNYFTAGNRLNIWLLCIEKLHDNFKSPIWK